MDTSMQTHFSIFANPTIQEGSEAVWFNITGTKIGDYHKVANS